MARKHQTHVGLQVLKPAAEARHTDLKGNGRLHLRLREKMSLKLYSVIFQQEACLQLYLRDPGQLCAELREGGMFLRLNIGVKLRLDLHRGGVQQNSREFN